MCGTGNPLNSFLVRSCWLGNSFLNVGEVFVSTLDTRVKSFLLHKILAPRIFTSKIRTMNRNILTGIFVLWASCASTAYANVVINEIAWMGTTVSANSEWIELYNPDSTAVDLSGWMLKADDGSPVITLVGTIAGNGYFLLERTSDDSILSVAADQIYTGSLGNELGETLRLKDKDGVDVNVVIGGASWINVGGDNTTKDTAQRIGSAWATARPTPRALNSGTVGEVAGAGIVVETNTTAETVANATAGSAFGTGVKSPYPRKNIVVDAGEDKRAFTAFPVAFQGSSTGLYNEPLTRATYRWNFGDGAISDERNVSHVYEFPGEYVVTLEVFLAEYHSADRLSVSVVNPDIIISKVIPGEKGYVELTNRTGSEMDLSGWSLSGVSGTPFVFSSNTIVLSKKTFLLSHRVSGIDFDSPQISLRYPDGTVAFTWGTLAPSASATIPTSVAGVSKQASSRVVSQGLSKSVATGRSVASAPSIAVAPTTQGATATAATILWQGGTAQKNSPFGLFSDNIMNWVLGLIVLALLVLAGFIIVGNQGGKMLPADEYIIIEGNEDNN